MPATPKARKRGGLHRRRIIERPRLLALLNGSPARVRTLIAPAGYGKTTLAEQWVGQEGRRHAWFTARPSSTDVAALALGLARAATAIVPDCEVRLREHLRALSAPAEHVDVLAELLGEELGGWPDDAWLVLDDYHEIVSNTEAERLVEELVANSPTQLFIASRQRPSWITARKILYGEVLELNQTELAMDGHEAADVLTDRNAASASGLVALAQGWPAVIGLASVSTAEIEQPESIPETLYEFFAEEIFSSLPPDVQSGVATLAIAPVIDRPLALALLGDRLDRVCEVSLGVGVLVERGTELAIHPLARAFLETRLEQLGVLPGADTVECCLRHFRARRDWDAAFVLIARWGFASQLKALLEDALDDLLETARLSTIESWCDHAESHSAYAEVFSVGRAEVALRRGRLAEAQAHAEAISAPRSDLQFRALSIAGRAAHLASRDEEALELYRHAERAAKSESSQREARWGQVLCMADLQMPEAVAILNDLTTSAFEDPREALRASTCELLCQFRFGQLDLSHADRASHCLTVVNDPIIETGFQSIYAVALAAHARYGEALGVVAALRASARRYRLDFALPWALSVEAQAQAGRRNWDAAGRALHEAIGEARRASNVHAEQNCLATRIRVLVQQGRHDLALDVSLGRPPDAGAPLPLQIMWAELLASRALALAVAEQTEEAAVLLDLARDAPTLEIRVLVAVVQAITSLKRHEPEAIDRIDELVDIAFTTGGLDLLVTAYRSSPELLAVLLRSKRRSDPLFELVRRVGDDDLARAVGYPEFSRRDPTATLTARERDVYALLRQALTNREIASILVISEGTVKLHVQHIFDKLGVRSRKTIAMQALLEHSAQATSAITDTGAEVGS